MNTNALHNAGVYNLPVASETQLGGIKIGKNLRIEAGVLSATGTGSSETTYAIGDGGLTEINYTRDDKAKLTAIAENANRYTLPTAAANRKGGVKVGTNLNMIGDVLHATDTIYSIGDGGLSAKNFTEVLHDKLDNMQAIVGLSADFALVENVLFLKGFDELREKVTALEARLAALEPKPEVA